MKNKKFLIFFFILIVYPSNAFSQSNKLPNPLSSIEEITKEMLISSDELKVAQKDIEEAERSLKLTIARLYPKISLQGSIGTDLLRMQEFDRERNTSMNIVLDWDPFQNGMAFFHIEQAKSNLLIKKILKQKLETEITFKIKKYCYELFVLEEEHTVAQQNLKTSKKELEHAELSYKQGNLDRSSLFKTKIALADKEIALSQISQSLSQLKKQIEEEIQSSISLSYEEIMTLAEQLSEKDLSLEELLEIGLSTRSEILMQAENKRISQLTKKYIKLKRFPQVQLFSGSSFALDDFGQSSNRTEFRTGIILKYALFDGGEVKHQIKTATANYEKSLLEYNQTQKEIKNQIKNTYHKLIQNRSLMNISKEKLKLIKEDLDLAEQEFKDGKISAYEWEIVTSSYLSTKLKHTKLKITTLALFDQLLKEMGISSLNTKKIKNELSI